MPGFDDLMADPKFREAVTDCPANTTYTIDGGTYSLYAVHEAGHAVAAFHQGIPIESLAVGIPSEADDNIAGGVVTKMTEATLQTGGIIATAGMATELVAYERADTDMPLDVMRVRMLQHSTVDLDNLHNAMLDMLHVEAALSDLGVRNQMILRLLTKSQELIEAKFDDVLRLAARIGFGTAVMNGSEVESLLSKAYIAA